jgi:hypothetical protein
VDLLAASPYVYINFSRYNRSMPYDSFIVKGWRKYFFYRH